MSVNGYSGMLLRVGARKGDRDYHGYPLWVEAAHDRTGKTVIKTKWESEG